MSKIWGCLSRLLTKDHHVRINKTECIYNNLQQWKTCTVIVGKVAYSAEVTCHGVTSMKCPGKLTNVDLFSQESVCPLLQNETKYPYLSFDTLNRIHNNCNSSFRECFKTLRQKIGKIIRCCSHLLPSLESTEPLSGVSSYSLRVTNFFFHWVEGGGLTSLGIAPFRRSLHWGNCYLKKKLRMLFPSLQ